MSEKPNGGPAFPRTAKPHEAPEFIVVDGYAVPTRSGVQIGMTLRDYFAAIVLQGWLADGAMQRVCQAHPELSPEENMPTVTKACYAFADAMISEREK